MQRVFVAITLVSLLVISAVGCSSMSSMLSEPEWSENYVLKGECDLPELNDGSMYTTAKMHPPEYIKGERADDSRFSDAIVTLKEPKDIRRIVLRRRSEDVAAVDIDILVMEGDDWKEVKQVRGEVGIDSERGNDIDIRLKVVADKIRIRAQRATRTAKGKSAVSSAGTSGGRRGAQMERVLREPIKLAEIEMYGIKEEAGS